MKSLNNYYGGQTFEMKNVHSMEMKRNNRNTTCYHHPTDEWYSNLESLRGRVLVSRGRGLMYKRTSSLTAVQPSAVLLNVASTRLSVLWPPLSHCCSSAQRNRLFHYCKVTLCIPLCYKSTLNYMVISVGFVRLLTFQ